MAFGTNDMDKDYVWDTYKVILFIYFDSKWRCDDYDDSDGV